MATLNWPPAPKLSPQQRQALKSDDGLTDKQLESLSRALPDVAFELQRSAKLGEVRDEVDSLARLLSAAAAMVGRWSRARRPDPDAEALALLNRAGAMVRWTGDAADACIGYPVGTEIVQLAAAIAAQAQLIMPAGRRTSTVASAAAIESIRAALEGPRDAQSRAAAAGLPVSYAAPSATKPSFFRVAATVFEAVTGNKDANPERAIRNFQNQKRRRAIAAAATS